MQSGRTIITLQNNVLAPPFETANIPHLLSPQNRSKAYSIHQSGVNIYTEDLAATVTSVFPEFDNIGRQINASDIITTKYDAVDLIKLLKPNELYSLILRANEVYQTVNKAINIQSEKQPELKNPLPEVKL